jgi:hypothetical protein
VAQSVDLFDAMPSVGRKFLMAGKSGLNLTHAEPFPQFMARFGHGRGRLEPIVAGFDPTAIRVWAAELGIETFVGSSGRVFPTDFKAAPLLRAWLRRLRAAGVRFHVRHHWTGWNDAGATDIRNARRTGTLRRRRHDSGAGRCKLAQTGIGRRLARTSAPAWRRGRAAVAGQLRLRCRLERPICASVSPASRSSRLS